MWAETPSRRFWAARGKESWTGEEFLCPGECLRPPAAATGSNSGDSHTDTHAFIFTVRGRRTAFGVESSWVAPALEFDFERP
jgi:hypothetical protein